MMCPHVRMRMMVGSVVPPPSPSTLPAAPPEMAGVPLTPHPSTTARFWKTPVYGFIE